jgi:hypothetical protein
MRNLKVGGVVVCTDICHVLERSPPHDPWPPGHTDFYFARTGRLSSRANHASPDLQDLPRLFVPLGC